MIVWFVFFPMFSWLGGRSHRSASNCTQVHWEKTKTERSVLDPSVFLASSVLGFSLMKDMSVQIGNQVLVDSADLNQVFKLGIFSHICLTCWFKPDRTNRIARTNMTHQPDRPRVDRRRRVRDFSRRGDIFVSAWLARWLRVSSQLLARPRQ